MSKQKASKQAMKIDHIVLGGKVVQVRAGAVPTSPESAQYTDMKSVAQAMKAVSEIAAFDHIGYDAS